MKKRLLSLLLCVSMIATMLPFQTFALGTATSVTLKNEGGRAMYTVNLDGGTSSEINIAVTIFTKDQNTVYIDDIGDYLGYQHVYDNSYPCVLNTNSLMMAVGAASQSYDMTDLMTPNEEYVIYAYATGASSDMKSASFATGPDGLVTLPKATAPEAPTIEVSNTPSGTEETVTVPTTITLTASPEKTIDTDFADYTYTYAWTGPNSFTASTADITLSTVAASGEYSVTATRIKTDGSTSMSDVSLAKTKTITINKGTFGQPTLAISAATYEYGSDVAMPTFTPTAGSPAATEWVYAVASGTSAITTADGDISLAGANSSEKIGATTFTVKGKGTDDYNESPVSAAVTLTVTQGTPAATVPSKTGLAPGTTVKDYEVNYDEMSSPFTTADATKVAGRMTITSADKGTIAGGATVSGLNYKFEPTDSTLYKTVTGSDASLTAGAAKELAINWGTIADITYGEAAPSVAPTVSADSTSVDAAGNWKLTYKLGNGAEKDTLGDTAHLSTGGKLKAGTYTITLTSINGLYTAPTANTTTFEVTPQDVAIKKGTLAFADKDYNGTKTPGTESGAAVLPTFVASDVVSVTGSATYAFADKNVADGKAVIVTGYSLTGTDVANYKLTDTDGNQIAGLTGNIKKLSATIKLPSSITKVYDGTAVLPNSVTDLAGPATTANINEFVAGDNFSLTFGASAYAGKDAGTTTISWSGVQLTGTDAKNYDLTVPTAAGEITKATMDNTFSIPALTYGDAGKSVTLNKALPLGSTVVYKVVANSEGDNAAGFGAVEVGDYLTVDSSGNIIILKSVAAGTVKVLAKITNTNYNDYYTSAAVVINKKELTLKETQESVKISDGATGITLVDTNYIDNPTDLVDLGSASASLTYTVGSTNDITAAVDGSTNKLTWDTSATAGKTAKIVVTMAVNDYYTLKANSEITVTASAKDIGDSSAITFTAPTLTYNGSKQNVAVEDAATFTRPGDDAGLSITKTVAYEKGDGAATENFTTCLAEDVKTAGNYKAIVSVETDNKIYTKTVTFSIGKKAIAITAHETKEYNGNVTMALTKTGYAANDNVGIVQGDTITIGGTAEYSSKNVHEKTAADITGVTFAGTNAENYTVTYTLTGAITAKALTFTMPTISKVFDAGKAIETADITAIEGTTLTGLVIGEDVKLSAEGLAYLASDVAASIAITGEWKLAGTEKGNYTLTQPASPTGAITVRPLAVEGAGNVKFSTGKTITVADLLKGKVVVNEGLAGGNTIATLFKSPLTFIENAAGVSDNTWTSGNVTVIFFAEDGVTRLAAAPGGATGKFKYTIAVTAENPFATNYNLSALAAVAAADLEIESAPYIPPTESKFDVVFNAGEFGKVVGETTVKVDKGQTATAPKVETKAGYVFKGWSIDGKTAVDVSKTVITAKTTFTALYGKIDHFAYIKGMTDTTFIGDAYLTRAQAATMLARLSAGYGEKAENNEFVDVDKDMWYYDDISFAASKGIVEGYGEGLFVPGKNITRAEFTAMLARFIGAKEPQNPVKFADCVGHWAEKSIAVMTEMGIIDGYEDGQFKPQQTITRYEAVKMINMAINRVPTEELVDANMGYYVNPFTDVTDSAHWAYYHVLESAISHVSGDFHKAK